MFELPSFLQNKALESHEKVCENQDFCDVVISFEDIKILKPNQYLKSDKMPYIIYADLESLVKNIDGRKISLKNYLQQK